MTSVHAYDELTVDHVVAGYDLPLTGPERREVVRRLKDRRWSNSEIAERLGVARRQVERDLAAWTPQPEPPGEPIVRYYPEDKFDDHAMRGAAARLIGAVHDFENVWEELAIMPPDDVKALVIILAACCDPDRSINDMLRWVDELPDLSGFPAAQ